MVGLKWHAAKKQVTLLYIHFIVFIFHLKSTEGERELREFQGSGGFSFDVNKGNHKGASRKLSGKT